MRATFRLGLAHLLANAVLLSVGYYWLGIGESRRADLVLSATVALLLLAMACSSYGAVFAFFESAERKQIRTAWKSALRHVLPLAVAAMFIAALYWLLTLWQDYSANPAFTLASYLTLTFRKPVTPAAVQKVLDDGLWVLRWVALPVLLLPMLGTISARGWSGFKAAGSKVKTWWFWIVAPLLLLCAIKAPLAVLGWRPHSGSFGMEMTSFVLRATCAYLLFAVGGLALAFATSAGKPRLAQSSTADSP